MKGFKQLALTTAILAASGSALALEAMDDASLSSTTGQDGLTITIDQSDITGLDITWADRDGFGSASSYSSGGSVLIRDVGVNIDGLAITVDAGSLGAGTAAAGQLRIGVTTTGVTTVNLHDAANTNPGNGATIAVGGAGAGSVVDNAVDIIRFGDGAAFTISSGVSAVIKLGNRITTVGSEEHFMELDTGAFNVALTGGIVILDAVNSAAAGADVGIGIGNISVSNIVLSNDINVVEGGLQINTAGTSIGEIALENIVLGNQTTQASIGDVYLSGLTANSVITITGHNN